jgi:hypothetical protein
MLATEPTTPDGDKPATPATSLETWSQNERMRHIPLVSWMIQKLERDVRRRFDILHVPFANLPAGDPRRAPIEHEFRQLCRSLDRVADVAKRPRGQSHPPTELAARINWAINHAVGNLQAMDDTFGKRHPFHTGERSNSEPLNAAMLQVINHLHRLQELVRELDPKVDEALYSDLVTLNEPLRREPIA